MIDSHCHLEQSVYENNLDNIIKKCKTEGIKALITSCAHPKDFERTLEIITKYKDYVFACISIHPSYIKEFTDNQINEFIEKIKKHSDKFVAIGETGLDYSWVEEPEQRKRQAELFIKMIRLSKELNKPLVIHAREALEETLKILNQQNAANVMLHMWGGHNLMDEVNALGYYVSMNSIIMRSKTYRKVVKKIPLEKLMLETDSPWMAVKKVDNGYEIDSKATNDPTTIKLIAKKISEIKNIGFNELWTTCGNNSIIFFRLPLNR